MLDGLRLLLLGTVVIIASGTRFLIIRIDSLIFRVLLTHALLRLHCLGGRSRLGGLLRLVELCEVKQGDVNLGGWHRCLSIIYSISVILLGFISLLVDHSRTLNRCRVVMVLTKVI